MMNGLNWLIEGPDDFEYKKYKFLGYIKKIETEFKETKLHPYYRLLEEGKAGIEAYEKESQKIFHSTKMINGINHLNKSIHYRSEVSENLSESTVDRLVKFSKPLLYSKLEEGFEIQSFAISNVILEPIGVLPLYKKEGILLIPYLNNYDLIVLRYNSGLFENGFSHFKINFTFLKMVKKSMFETYSSLKRRLMSSLGLQWNPAVYLMFSEIEIPLIETFLPVAKQRLSDTISN